MTNLQPVRELHADSESPTWPRGPKGNRVRHIFVTQRRVPSELLTAPWSFTPPPRQREVDWLADVTDEMRSYLELPPNWDSYGGGPVREEIVKEAVEVAKVMAECGFSRPDVCPESSGGILLEWQQSDRVLTVDIDGLGEFTFSYESPGQPESEGSLEDFLASLPRADLQPF